MDWRDDSEIKSIFWPYKEPKFSLLHAHDSSQLFVTIVPWKLMSSSDLCRTEHDAHIYMQAKHSNASRKTNKSLKPLKEQSHGINRIIARIALM